MTSYPEPPAVGGEVETLIGSLERQRATFAYKCGDLTDDQMRRKVGASEVTIGGLLKHLAYMEDLNFTQDLAKQMIPSPWAHMEPKGRGERVWLSAAEDDARSLYSLWEGAVARSRDAVHSALGRGGLDLTFEVRPGTARSLRRLIIDFIEEYGRHTGHTDLLRESIDGRVGEDPPGDPYPYVLH